MYLSELSCNLPTLNTPAPHSSSMAVTLPPTKSSGMGDCGCGCGGKCGGKDMGLGSADYGDARYPEYYGNVGSAADRRYKFPYYGAPVRHDGIGNYQPVANPVAASRITSSNRVGLGLFDSMDFTTWGVGEWGVVIVGAYLVGSLIGDTGRARKSVKRRFRRRAA
jgi:hypothetical protein